GATVPPPDSVLQCQPSSVTTGADGRASFTLTATPAGPGDPRGNIDGQVYKVTFSWPLNTSPDRWVFISARVFTLVQVPGYPSWGPDVLPILGPYYDLYPFMAQMINLADPTAVLQNGPDILFRLQVSQDDPRHMPVTRDLSANKAQIVVSW